jgi:tripartite-type tricarboxylate transporter receptor subunit TctC
MQEEVMKRLILATVLLLMFSGISFEIPTVQAQPYPNRPIQLIIPIPAGGGGDVNGRLLVEDLTKILGQQIVVVNKPGASDTLGTDALAKSKKDGYTLGYTSSAAMVFARVTNPESVPYDPVKDFDPLGSHTFFPLCVAVQASSPWKTFNDLIEYAKKNPGKLRVSTAGVGSTANFDVEITKTLTGVEFTHVPFKGGEAVVTALLGGHVEVSFDIVGKFVPHVEAGKVRILLVSRKISFLPSVPTITELGYKRELLSGWHGLFAPAGLPEDVKKVLIPAIKKAVNQPETKAKIEKTGYVVEYRSPEEQRRLITNDYETAQAIAAKLGLGK